MLDAMATLRKRLFIFAVLLTALSALAADEERRNPLLCDEPYTNGHTGNRVVGEVHFYFDRGAWHHFRLDGDCDADLSTCLGASWSNSVVSSTNQSVAVVDSSGVIQPIGLGFTTLTIRGPTSTKYIYVEVSRIDSTRIDYVRWRGFSFIDWTPYVEIAKGQIIEHPIWDTQILTITNNGDIPLRSNDVLLRIDGLTEQVAAVQLCPGPVLFTKEGAPLRLSKEFLLPGESQTVKVIFANWQRRPFVFTPKVYWAHDIKPDGSAR